MGQLPDWSPNKIKFSVNNAYIDEDLYDFRLLVKLSYSSGTNPIALTDIFAQLKSNHKKIAVTTSNGTTQCYIEVEKWDHENKEARLWVKVPLITAKFITVLYLYYDPAHEDNTDYVIDTHSESENENEVIMALTPEEGFGIGTEVELTDPAPDYIINERNPVKGGMYACIGSIYSVIDTYNVGVRWGNGTTNVYRIHELSYAENSQSYNSIW